MDRIFYALHEYGVSSSRSWEAEKRSDEFAPGLRILCDNGSVLTASTRRGQGVYYLDSAQSEDAILQSILAQIASNGGPATVSIPTGD